MDQTGETTPPMNKTVLSDAPGTPQRATLKQKVCALATEQIEIPAIIGGREVRTGNTSRAAMPHKHGQTLAVWHKAGKDQVEQAVKSALEAQREWSSWRWEDRAAVFLRAAERLATTWRPVLNAATMLCQSKTAHQAEIDSACELIDYWRFNVHFAQSLYAHQPLSSPRGWNRLDYPPPD